MKAPRRLMRSMVAGLVGCLLQLYPKRFRTAFGDEIQEIVLRNVIEAEAQGGWGLLNTFLRELSSLAASIIKEQWHELKSRKEPTMSLEENLPDAANSGGGGQPVMALGLSSWTWIPLWAVVTTAAFPAALIMMAPLAALLLLMLDLGVDSGLLSSFNDDLLYPAGFFISLSVTLAAAQWFMLRRHLPSGRSWFVATAGGLLLGGLLAAAGIMMSARADLNPGWIMAAFVLPAGAAVGLAQWLVLRRKLPNAFWIVAIDVAAAGSLMLAGGSIVSLLGLLITLIVLMLPGLITGMGLWLLLREAQFETAGKTADTGEAAGPRTTRLAWIGVGLTALVPMFFLCIWLYASAQLALAKNEGIWATVEESVVARNSQGWGGAEVVSLEDVRAGPNRNDGTQSHVWFGGATVTLDRVPQGGRHSQYAAGSYYIHVEEGWVHVPEGAFPTFIGWVMDFYGLEGVREWNAAE